MNNEQIEAPEEFCQALDNVLAVRIAKNGLIPEDNPKLLSLIKQVKTNSKLLSQHVVSKTMNNFIRRAFDKAMIKAQKWEIVGKLQPQVVGIES